MALKSTSAKSIRSSEWSEAEGILYFQGKIYVPPTSDIRWKIVAPNHDSRVAGHPGRWKTLELVSRNYWWPQMSRYIGQYTATCDLCLRTKIQRQLPTGHLEPLPTPETRYLDASDIRTNRPSQKLSHRRLGPFPIERQVSRNAYRLKLPFPMRHLDPVFNVVKLTPSPADLIVGRHLTLPPPLEVIDGEEEYLVEKILDSKMFRGHLRFKIKWEGYGPKHDS
jgi:hypothetical protein